MTTMTSGAATATTAVPYKEQRFITISLPSYTANFWTGPGDIVVNGKTYTGVGAIGSAGPISDNSDLSAQRLQLSLSWIAPHVWDQVKNIAHQGSPIEIIVAQIDGSDVIIQDPYDVFSHPEWEGH